MWIVGGGVVCFFISLFNGASTVICPMACSWPWACFLCIGFCLYLKIIKKISQKKSPCLDLWKWQMENSLLTPLASTTSTLRCPLGEAVIAPVLIVWYGKKIWISWGHSVISWVYYFTWADGEGCRKGQCSSELACAVDLKQFQWFLGFANLCHHLNRKYSLVACSACHQLFKPPDPLSVRQPLILCCPDSPNCRSYRCVRPTSSLLWK